MFVTTHVISAMTRIVAVWPTMSQDGMEDIVHTCVRMEEYHAIAMWVIKQQ